MVLSENGKGSAKEAKWEVPRIPHHNLDIYELLQNLEMALEDMNLGLHFLRRRHRISLRKQASGW